MLLCWVGLRHILLELLFQIRQRSYTSRIAVSDKTEADSERERALIEQWVCLTEERNAVLVPSPGSNIPGAPADW